MNFGNLKTQLAKRTIHEREFDFGGEIGKQKIHLGNVSYAERKRLFIEPAAQSNGVVDPMKVAEINAEVVAAVLCDEKGKSVATVKEVNDWDPEIVDRLSALVMEVIPLGIKKAEATADPSAATS
jgi:hypothetical protein